MLHGFILEAAVLIIMAGCYAHTTLLPFAAYSGNMIIFVAVKVLDDSIFFMEQFASFKLIVKNQFFIN